MAEGLLLDSGDTIIGPKGGRWNPRFDFEQVLLRHWPEAPADRFPDAFGAGRRFLDDYGTTPPRDLYHRAILKYLGMDQPPDELLDELDLPLPFSDVVEVFPDVRATLDELRARGKRMAIVSDNWSGLDQVYEELGLRAYFDVFIISEELGCRKPDPRMYQAGSEALGLTPQQCLFVDDDADLVAAAIALGYEGVTIDRKGTGSVSPVPSIATLEAILTLV